MQQDKEERKETKSKINRQTIFATVSSVVGALLFFDAVIYKGKHTMGVINSFTGNNNNRGL